MQHRRAPLSDNQGTRDRRCSKSAEVRERRLALDEARKWRRLALESAEEYRHDYPDVKLESDRGVFLVNDGCPATELPEERTITRQY